MNINFYKVTYELRINGFYCGTRTLHYQMKKGFVPKEEVKTWNVNDKLPYSMLTNIFDLRYDTTPFKNRGFYYDFWESVSLPYELLKRGPWYMGSAVLWEDDIKFITINYTYEMEDAPSFEKVMQYPADLVIEYMKERGLAYCPKI